MDKESLIEQMRAKCINKVSHGKIFTSEEIEAIYLLMDDPNFSIPKTAKFLHCKDEKIKLVIDELKPFESGINDDDVKAIKSKINKDHE